jgi:4-oxalomesaconate hydratase
MTLETVKRSREAEARRAADILGCEIVFYDIGDYPMRISDETIYRLADEFRDLRPEWVLTHSLEDPYNFDHPLTAHATQEARVIAQAHGHKYPEKPIGVPGIFLFEPHQTEQCNWRPDLILDITEVWEKKAAAFECMAAQEYLWEYYTRVALQRGVQGKRNSTRDMTYGEAYMRILPVVAEEFV